GSLVGTDVSPVRAATPSAPTATFGNGQATVTWTKPADNGSAITGYTVTSSGGQTCTTNDADTLTCVVTGLTNGTAYTFTVTATNGGGASAASVASSSVTPAGPPATPSAPTAAIGNGQATVTWTKPADNGSTITGYTVTTSGGQTCTTSGADTLTCVVTGLTNGTAYTFTVTATNGGGTSAASVASSSITPVAPTPIPTLPLFAFGILVSLLGLFGLRKLRQ
ncbi:MAG: fibronectin type III domain-containing protein, partial [Luminiphilus sp.]|nr:fibronectin type III domain-containing protein [Luminiphilus sp.]